MAADVLGSGKSPLEYLLEVMMDENADEKRRDWAAEKAAAYLHPRPAPVPRTIKFTLPKLDGAQDIPAAIAAVLKAISEEQMSPAEGQSIVSVIESHRKAIETGEIVERLKVLEAAVVKQ
jgi:hypothetical protein